MGTDDSNGVEASTGKSRTTAAVLAILTGWFGGHKFYLGETSKGVLYLVFLWTMIPAVVGVYHGVKFLTMDDADFAERASGSAAAPEEKEYVMRVHGVNGQVELHDSKVRITRDGLMATLIAPGRGETEIPLRDIKGIQFKEGGWVTNGYIQFGGGGHKLDSGGTFDMSDEANAVNFKRGKNEEFRELREKVEKLREEARDGDSGGSGSDAVERLKERFAEGEISKEEFEERKAALEEA